jgi:two-component system response regulator MprA
MLYLLPGNSQFWQGDCSPHWRTPALAAGRLIQVRELLPIAVQKSFFQRPDRFGAERIYLYIRLNLKKEMIWGYTLWYILFRSNAMNERILIIEDDQAILKLLQRGLAYEGYTVDTAIDGRMGLIAARDHTPDLVVLDWMLPGMDGLEVCHRLRTGGSIPILMLTAKDTVQDRIQGLDAGADDYMVKPFNLDELLARVRALLRRTQPERIPVLKFADLSLDTGSRQAQRGNRMVALTAKEYELLELFLRHPKQVLTREVIFDRVWGYDFGGESNVLEVYIRYLRQKLEGEGEMRLIHTVRGVGYVMRENP